VQVSRSVSTLEPHADFARVVARFNVHHSRAAAHGAVFNVSLLLAAALVDVELFGLSAKRANRLG